MKRQSTERATDVGRSRGGGLRAGERSFPVDLSVHGPVNRAEQTRLGSAPGFAARSSDESHSCRTRTREEAGGRGSPRVVARSSRSAECEERPSRFVQFLESADRRNPRLPNPRLPNRSECRSPRGYRAAVNRGPCLTPTDSEQTTIEIEACGEIRRSRACGHVPLVILERSSRWSRLEFGRGSGTR